MGTCLPLGFPVKSQQLVIGVITSTGPTPGLLLANLPSPFVPQEREPHSQQALGAGSPTLPLLRLGHVSAKLLVVVGQGGGACKDRE